MLASEPAGVPDKQVKQKSEHRANAAGSQQTALVVGLIGGLIALVIKTMQSDKLVIGSTDTSLYRGMHGLSDEYDLVIVGAGLSGAVIAERASSELGLTSLVIDKREHIGGNCYDFIDEHGIRISLYGVHIFHTKYPRVEKYVKKFSKWVAYKHKVLGQVKDVNETDKIVPIPPNIDTVNAPFGTDINTEEEMIKWLDERRPKLDQPPQNGEEMSISRVGTDLYEKIFKQYTKKQWTNGQVNWMHQY
eukprot:TRINITY_DN3131_c0_g1_i1.p1 TRINITY_DN3131_c0_g1~~TRINITY_DN3131_c0_g1_i1.p1  ORF type:complete len:247 (+),score=57.37 TRINITY_DN3131_c0_g1_i1:99-839(+)